MIITDKPIDIDNYAVRKFDSAHIILETRNEFKAFEAIKDNLQAKTLIYNIWLCRATKRVILSENRIALMDGKDIYLESSFATSDLKEMFSKIME